MITYALVAVARIGASCSSLLKVNYGSCKYEYPITVSHIGYLLGHWRYDPSGWQAWEYAKEV